MISVSHCWCCCTCCAFCMLRVLYVRPSVFVCCFMFVPVQQEETDLNNKNNHNNTISTEYRCVSDKIINLPAQTKYEEFARCVHYDWTELVSDDSYLVYECTILLVCRKEVMQQRKHSAAAARDRNHATCCTYINVFLSLLYYIYVHILCFVVLQTTFFVSRLASLLLNTFVRHASMFWFTTGTLRNAHSAAASTRYYFAPRSLTI